MSAWPRRVPDEEAVPLSPREIREQAMAELPDAGELLRDQHVDAVYRLHQDARKFPTFPWAKLAEMSGPMCPEDVIMVLARTGGGKSLFLQNLFDSLISAGRCGLYVGLEQSPAILRTKWACLRAGVDPRLVLATRPEEHGTPRWHEAMASVQDELLWQRDSSVRESAMFASARMINAKGLQQWTDWAVARGAEFVILDHIDRIEHGEGKNPFHEMSLTMRLAKELAAEHQLVMLIASQVGRPGDALEAYMPPALHNARGGGTKEEESDTVLGVFRPLRAGTTEKDMKRVRQGFTGPETIIEPGQMGVRLLKHRLDGAMPAGKIARLAVHHGRITDLPERDQYGTSYDATRLI
jgi:replicative DNA helicase